MPLKRRKSPANPAGESPDDRVRYRSIMTGGYVSEAYARKHPETVAKVHAGGGGAHGAGRHRPSADVAAGAGPVDASGLRSYLIHAGGGLTRYGWRKQFGERQISQQ